MYCIVNSVRSKKVKRTRSLFSFKYTDYDGNINATFFWYMLEMY